MRPLDRDPRSKRERLLQHIQGFTLGFVAAAVVLSLTQFQTQFGAGIGGSAITPASPPAGTLRADGDSDQGQMLHLGGAVGERGVVRATAKLCDSALLENFRREEVRRQTRRLGSVPPWSRVEGKS